MVNFSNAFDRTVVHFGLTGKQLSADSGVSEGVISKFRHGKADILSGSLAALVAALPLEARQYFFSQALGGSISAGMLIKGMNSDQKGELLMAIASSMSSKPGNSAKLGSPAVKETVGNFV